MNNLSVPRPRRVALGRSLGAGHEGLLCGGISGGQGYDPGTKPNGVSA